jgi:hypothetical protein
MVREMNIKPWRLVAVSSLSAGLVTGLLGIAFLLYLIIAAEDNPGDLCEMTEIGQGLLPYGNEGGCNPRWLMWGIAFLYYAGIGALPVGAVGIILALVMTVWRQIGTRRRGS